MNIGNVITKFNHLKTFYNRKYNLIIGIILVIISAYSCFFVSNNESYYDSPIAKITSVTQTKCEVKQELNNRAEKIYRQHIRAKIMNGSHKGEMISLSNVVAYSQVNSLRYKKADEVFISINEYANKKIKDCIILDFKRDIYISYIAIIFILLILLVAGFKGFRSLVSVIMNVLIFYGVIHLYLSGWNTLVICVIASISFSIVSISIAIGMNKKTVSAILGTICGTGLSMLIAVFVIHFSDMNGLHYETIDLPVGDPEKIFLLELLMGTLGGIMDIAISISSAIKEMYDNNPLIERKALIKSSMNVGKDIMGTMANTLVFAYISGNIPMIILLLGNNFSISYIISFYLSLDITRALVGSIGIVISIPITMYIAVVLLKDKKVKEV